jgi:hypothetical protein
MAGYRLTMGSFVPITMLVCCFIYGGILLTTDSLRPLSSSSGFDAPRHRSHRGGHSAYKETSEHQSVYNKTLGFGEVFYLSLPRYVHLFLLYSHRSYVVCILIHVVEPTDRMPWNFSLPIPTLA